MLSTSDILDAYRADLSNAGKPRFSERDGEWLAFGTMLQRAVGLPAADRAVYLQGAGKVFAEPTDTEGLRDALARLARDGSCPTALCTAVTLVASEIEDAGAFSPASPSFAFRAGSSPTRRESCERSARPISRTICSTMWRRSARRTAIRSSSRARTSAKPCSRA